jgi:hypothetical protein
LENSHRGAKEWLSGVMESQYKATTDQAALTKMVDFQRIRDRNMKSFKRLEHAIDELIDAVRTGRHVSTP